jgi:hypothetical protein
MLGPGDVMLLPVSETRAVALRVVAIRADECCVLATRWEGPLHPARVAVSRSRRVRQPRPLEHHERRRPLLGAWLSQPLPLQRFARAPRRAEPPVIHPREWARQTRGAPLDASRVVPRLGWSQFVEEVRTQWRWEHDRRALLDEEAAVRRAGQGALAAALAATREVETLQALARASFLAPWRSEKPRPLYLAAVGILRRAATQLAGAAQAEATAVMRRAVDEIRALDARWEFDDDDLDDLRYELRRLARAAGVSLDAP